MHHDDGPDPVLARRDLPQPANRIDQLSDRLAGVDAVAEHAAMIFGLLGEVEIHDPGRRGA